eukprot:TRINITY_DN24067_c0_g1_i1.p1 TRINITY_DN24067_c0_g1~~TRINITY_DN24067_c0_g1_i1.p1  ORF type:complete len:462 (-),score=88.84 TRINITY_DN24067_c0_g1_i1:179-1495(-)
MSPIVAASSTYGVPFAQPPLFARTPAELRAVADAQGVEARTLRARLAEGQRECAQLRVRLRDSTEDVSVASEAIASATERLEAHAGRRGLLLEANVERCGAERAALEDELQRFERLLWERDQEISRLQQQNRQLEAVRLQGELELTGLAVAHEAASSEVRNLGADVLQLRQNLDGSVSANPMAGPSPSNSERMETSAAALAAKRASLEEMQRRAKVVAEEAKRLEKEGGAFEEHVRNREQVLRRKQDLMDQEDRRLINEAGSLREHGEGLRSVLREQQRDAIEVDQRAALQDRCGEEAKGVRRELAASYTTMRGLVEVLRERRRFVRSPEVPNDPVDVRLGAYLRGCGGGGKSHDRGFGAYGGGGFFASGDPMPPLVWRISHGEYLLGEDRVHITEAPGGILMVRGSASSSVMTPLRDFLQRQAQAHTPGTPGLLLNV